ncbi:MAG: DUF447 domain-containing protein [Methylophilaceae bacterium]
MIFETIIISVDPQGVAHVTPFGVRHEGEKVIISPFRPSKTLDNILSSKSATMNLTDDVRVFAGALTKKVTWRLLPASQVTSFRLDGCLSHVELELIDVREDAARPQLVMQVVETQHHKGFDGFNRAQAAVIELAVLTSRLHILPAEKVQSELKYLQIAVDKTAGERELEAWGWLTEKIDCYYKDNPA